MDTYVIDRIVLYTTNLSITLPFFIRLVRGFLIVIAVTEIP